jgi:hypothetical protein
LGFIDISGKNSSEKESSEKDELEKFRLQNEKMNIQMTADKKMKKIDVGDDNKNKNNNTDKHDSFKLELSGIKQQEIAPFSLNDVVDGLFILSNGTQRWYPGEILYIRIYVYTYICMFIDEDICTCLFMCTNLSSYLYLYMHIFKKIHFCNFSLSISGKITQINADSTYSIEYTDGDIHFNKVIHEIRLSKSRSSRSRVSSVSSVSTSSVSQANSRNSTARRKASSPLLGLSETENTTDLSENLENLDLSSINPAKESPRYGYMYVYFLCIYVYVCIFIFTAMSVCIYV